MAKFSFIIRFRDEEKYIGECLNAIARQKGNHKIEIILIDDHSKDDGPAIVNDFLESNPHIKVKIVQLKDEFTFSSAINTGLDYVTGDYAVVFSAHATIATDEWLNLVLENFKDPNVAIVYGRLMVRKDANMLSLMTSLPVSKPWKIIKSSEYFSRKDDDLNAFSYINLNTCNCIRADLLKKYRFRELPSVEDMDLGKRLLEDGYKIIYEPLARVWHSHNDPTEKMVNRWITAAVGMRLIFKGKVPGKLSLLKSTAPSYFIFMLKVSNRERNPVLKFNYFLRAVSGALSIISKISFHYDQYKNWENKYSQE